MVSFGFFSGTDILLPGSSAGAGCNTQPVPARPPGGLGLGYLDPKVCGKTGV